jgi:hypothetical protein
MVMSPLQFWPLTDSTTNYRPVLLSERELKDEKQSNFQAKKRKKLNLVMGPKGVPDTKTYWLTVSRKVTWTSISTSNTLYYMVRHYIPQLTGGCNQWEGQAVLERFQKGENLSVCSGARTMESQLSALWVKSCCGCWMDTVREPRGKELLPLEASTRELVKGLQCEKA